MKKKLKIISFPFIFAFMGWMAQAQKIGNGGNFNTDEARVIIEKFVFVLKNNMLRDMGPVTLQWIEALQFTNKVYDLRGDVYPRLKDYIVVTNSLEKDQEKNTLCVIASTEMLASMHGAITTGELIKKLGQYLRPINSIEGPEKVSVIEELQRGVADKFISSDCVIE